MFARRRGGEKRGYRAGALLPVYLALKYTLVHVFGKFVAGRDRGREGTIHPALYRSLSFIQRNVNPPASGLGSHSRNANISRSRREILQLHENPRAAGADVNILESSRQLIRISPRSGFYIKGMNSARRMTNAPLQNDPSDKRAS